MVTNGEVFRINHPDAKLINVGSDIVGVKIGDDITCYDKNWWNKKAKGVTDEIEKLAIERRHI
jgi:hypothetical protein